MKVFTVSSQSLHTEQLGVLGVWMKALLFTSGDLKHASIGKPEDASVFMLW